MPRPFFSIVMPAFNREHLISKSLDSIIAQQFTDFEIIVIDDGSADSTCDVVRKYENVTLIEQSNNGPGAARNRGVELCRGNYIAFLDSDDLWFPWTLRRYAEVIHHYNSPAFVTGKPMRFASEDSLQSAHDQPTVCQVFADFFSSGERWLWYGVSSFVIRHDAFVAVGGFANGCINGEDAEMAMKLGNAGGFVHVASPAMFGYRDHGENVTLDTQKSLQGMELLLEGERQGRFPGGRERAKERALTISRHVRPCAVECAKRGDTVEAFRLYFAVLAEALRRFRWRFILGVPALAVFGGIVRGAKSLASWRATGHALNPFPVLHRAYYGLACRLRNFFYRALGVRITGQIWMRAIEIPRCWNQIRLEHCALDRGVTLLATGPVGPQPKIHISSGTYINRFTVIDAHASVYIGSGCMVGPHCYITDANHGTQPGISVGRQPMVTADVVIEDGVWLGAHVTVLKGVTIGAGAVIGAGSVVTKSIEPNSIAVGVPARVIADRMSMGEAA